MTYEAPDRKNIHAGLTPREKILAYLGRHDDANAVDIANAIGVEASYARQLLDAMHSDNEVTSTRPKNVLLWRRANYDIKKYNYMPWGACTKRGEITPLTGNLTLA